ncbi:cyclin-T isoform X2 [Eupeodes corollae]|uniref:cyclin-T isoform X2 n=1 Tax=Eupeodes corollae TaxID=290404 RepID=UPI002491A7B2|nr:cyclin-T isoform X2 [Eupeodes corollae]
MAAISNASSGSGNISSGIPPQSSSSSSSISNSGGAPNEVKEKDSIWYFTSEQLANSPSRRHGISPDQELSYRQMTAYLIQEMGQRLQVSQLCINTAIVYMHRFYAFHSFTHFSRNGIASASLFLAAKVEEQPRKLEHVIKASQKCQTQPPTVPPDANYNEQAQDLVFNENVLLQTLGFDVAIDHPHTHVVKTCHLVKGKSCKDLAQTSYFLASNSLHLTSMCLQYRPTVVACFCIYLACKWSRWEIPQSTEGKHWFHYVDKSVTMDLLKQLTDEFIAIYEKSPARLKSKLNSIKALAQGASNRAVSKDKKTQGEDWKMGDMLKLYHSSIPTDTSSNGGGMTMDQQVQQYQQEQLQQQQQQQLPPPPPSSSSQQARRSESHSSHHRPHHSSSSHHHSKQILPPSEIGEHKPVIHKQPYPTVGRQRDPSQPYPPVSGHSSIKQMQPPVQPPAGSSRSSSSQNRPPIAAISQIPQRPPPQAHDPNYHKSSSRSSVPAPPQLNPPVAVPNHKMMSKSESSSSSRMLHKDPNSRLVDPNKISSGKAYPPTSTQNVGVDMTRSMLQQSIMPQPQQQLRPYNTQAPNNTQAPPSSSIHPTAYPNRTTSISNSKYDQQLSVQMQQQQQIIHQQHQKQQQQQQQQPIIESSYNTQQQQLTQSSSMQQHPQQYSRQQVEDNYSKQQQQPPQLQQQGDQMELCSPPKYSQYTSQGFIPNAQQHQQQHQQQQQQQQLASKQSSIFSPEYIEKVPQSATNNGGSKIGGHKTSSRDSPKKSERSTPKKDKSRSSSSMVDVNTTMSSRQPPPGYCKQPKQEQASVIPPPYGATNYGVVKRPSSSMDMKQEEDLMLRDSKIRKIEMNPVSPPSSLKTSSSAFPGGTVNGIETNPDLVSSLLKESLCSTSGFIKTDTLIKSEYQDPMQLFDPTMTTLPEQILQSNPPAAIKEEQVISEVIKMEDQSADSVKLEKKKKKDKHKHKEKDKSKDKEERKKHKKDKDRHKDRERGAEASESSEPVKIKINLSNSSNESSVSGVPPPLGFKIKIPKDRILGDISAPMSGGGAGAGGVGGVNYDGSAGSAAPPLKIKISKDKLDSSYSSVGNMDQQKTMGTGIQGMSGYHQHHGSSGSNSTSGGSSSSSKKKDRDRDRDREKEKKRSSHDHSKMNGNSSNGGGGGNAMAPAYPTASMTSSSSNSTNSSSKGQASNKIHHHFNSSDMSHLFGESNDDDDDDDDDDDSDKDDIGSSHKLPPASSSSSSSSSHHKSKSSHGTSRYSSADNRYSSSNSSSGANMQQKFSQHRRQSSSSSSYQKSNNNNNW